MYGVFSSLPTVRLGYIQPMRRAIVLVLFAGSAAAQQASLEGVAVNALTGEPLSGVHVKLVTGVMGGVTGSYGAMSDRTGHFAIATVRPGVYILFCERSGYLQVQAKEAGIPNLTLKPGQQIKEYKVAMTPRAILAGKVLDENGDPVQGVRLETTPVPPTVDSFTFLPLPDPVTDDRGEFRVAIAPGRYYLRANTPQMGPQNQTPERRNDGSSAAAYRSTFYPSTATKEHAIPVEAVGGKETSGLEIRLTRQQGLSITGIVSGIPDQNSRANVSLQQVIEGPQRGNIYRNVAAGADGKFVVTGLEPGRYWIAASYSGKTPLSSRRAEIRLEGSAPPVTLALQAQGDLAGTLAVEGDPPGTPAGKLTVRLEPADQNWMNAGSLKGGQVDQDNAFHIEGVGPGKFRVRVDGLQENAYLKTINDAAASGDEGILDLQNGGAVRIKLAVSRAGAQISGRVLDSNGERLLTPLAMIALMKAPEDQMPFNAGREIKADGTFAIKGIAPGKYRLFAIDPFNMNPNSNGMDAAKKLFARGEEIEFKEGDRITKDVRMLPKEDANAK